MGGNSERRGRVVVVVVAAPPAISTKRNPIIDNEENVHQYQLKSSYPPS